MGAHERMERRRNVIADAKVSFSQLPPARQQELIWEIQQANDEALAIINFYKWKRR